MYSEIEDEGDWKEDEGDWKEDEGDWKFENRPKDVSVLLLLGCLEEN